MLTGHYDQLGFMVTYIDEKGYAKFSRVGGWDPRVVYSTRVRIWVGDEPDSYVTGVIGPKPVHLTESSEREKAIPVKDMRIDFGAKGIIVPMVNSKEEAIHMVRCCKYPPEGIRSAAGMRGEWGEFENFSEYMSAVNEELLIIPMVETLKALDNLDEILSVPGIDVLLVGPSDLSIALGIALDYLNLKYQKTLDKIAEACEKAGVVPGMYFLPRGLDPSEFVERGFRFFTRPWSRWAAAGIKDGLATIER
jgi:hypothetical protein